MKRLIASFVFLFAACWAGNAQVVEVVVDIRGNFNLIVEVGEDTYAEVSQWGELLDIYEHEPSPWRNERNPQFFSGVEIKYYDDFWEYRAGRIESIGNVRFDYHNDFWSYNARKISRVGNASIQYHNDFGAYSAGKVQAIGHIRFEYHDDFRPESSGLIKSINNERYEYAFTPDRWGGRPGSMPHGRPSSTASRHRPGGHHDDHYGDHYPGRPNGGMIISGKPRFETGGVVVSVVERLY